LKLVGQESGERRKGGAGYEANTYIKARNVGKNYQFQIHHPLEY
jgi:hypothetical protein